MSSSEYGFAKRGAFTATLNSPSDTHAQSSADVRRVPFRVSIGLDSNDLAPYRSKIGPQALPRSPTTPCTAAIATKSQTRCRCPPFAR